jgi:type III pantothenate kinase
LTPELLIDLGNSRLKWATWQGGQLQPGPAIAHRGRALGDLTPLLDAARGARSAWIASTALDLSAELESALAPQLLAPPRIFRPSAQALGIRNAYPNPERIGSDRFLAMAGAHAELDGAFLLVDIGTALTVDLCDAEGRHHGGLIVPGPELMRDALHRGTAGVRSASDPVVVDFADNTTDAVWSGALQACAGVIERMHGLAERRLGTKVELVLCGGAADPVAPLLGRDYRLLPDAVLDGLALWARDDSARRSKE